MMLSWRPSRAMNLTNWLCEPEARRGAVSWATRLVMVEDWTLTVWSEDLRCRKSQKRASPSRQALTSWRRGATSCAETCTIQASCSLPNDSGGAFVRVSKSLREPSPKPPNTKLPPPLCCWFSACARHVTHWLLCTGHAPASCSARASHARRSGVSPDANARPSRCAQHSAKPDDRGVRARSSTATKLVSSRGRCLPPPPRGCRVRWRFAVSYSSSSYSSRRW
mmetsp:Transcript_20822/g.64356  ORF Transcript_20822/g.64356 Transcript_20822/m.64356 type:complete len:223 (-) Transcript_20822:122-790(-)